MPVHGAVNGSAGAEPWACGDTKGGEISARVTIYGFLYTGPTERRDGETLCEETPAHSGRMGFRGRRNALGAGE